MSQNKVLLFGSRVWSRDKWFFNYIIFDSLERKGYKFTFLRYYFLFFDFKSYFDVFGKTLFYWKTCQLSLFRRCILRMGLVFCVNAVELFSQTKNSLLVQPLLNPTVNSPADSFFYFAKNKIKIKIKSPSFW